VGLTEADFDRAVEKTEKQLLELQRRLEDKIQDAASMIFGAHVLMLKDDAFSGEIRAAIRVGKNPWEPLGRSAALRGSVRQQSESDLAREGARREGPGPPAAPHLSAPALRSSSPDYAGQIIIAEEMLPRTS
jgi:phosphotransferase system enzyme I (PtsP)